ncbi:MAG: FHA domain-containing protein, partial [Polyangiales bacterium]
MSRGFAVTVLMPDGSKQELAIADTTSLTVGRDPACHIVLPSPAVSRIHLQIEQNRAGARVIDRSSNGTILAGERLSEAETLLAPGED